METFGVTGHRSIEQEPGELLQFARLTVRRMLDAGASEIITGFALGWDIAVARACLDECIPYIAAVPFPTQALHYETKDKVEYHFLLQRASTVHIIDRFADYKSFKKRNRWIVDSSHELWALKSPVRHGGTGHCVLYAGEVKRKVVPLWDDWIRFRERR